MYSLGTKTYTALRSCASDLAYPTAATFDERAV